jgi:hypothetical protein
MPKSSQMKDGQLSLFPAPVPKLTLPPETHLRTIVLLARMLHEHVTRSRTPKSEARDE